MIEKHELLRNNLTINPDSFTDGQMRSKLWLCEQLERFVSNKIENETSPKAEKIWVYGSWYGFLPWMLLVRGKMKVSELQLFDLDLNAILTSMRVLNHWDHSGMPIGFHTKDCFSIQAGDPLFEKHSPTILINTSCEHFSGEAWADVIPSGTLFVLQATNMVHETHCNRPVSLTDFVSKWSGRLQIQFQGQLEFNYPDQSFERYMIIGRKN